MTLNGAIRKAEITGCHFVYQIGRQWHLRGIRTQFTDEDYKQIDWQVYEERGTVCTKSV